MSQTNSNDTCDPVLCTATHVRADVSIPVPRISPEPSTLTKSVRVPSHTHRHRHLPLGRPLCLLSSPISQSPVLYRTQTISITKAMHAFSFSRPHLPKRLRVSLALPVRAAPGCQNTQNMSNPRRPVGPSSPARDVTAMRDAGGAGCRCEQSPAWRAWPTGCGRISFFHSVGSQARPRGPQIGVDISPAQ